jgi:hypothetical protein
MKTGKFRDFRVLETTFLRAGRRWENGRLRLPVYPGQRNDKPTSSTESTSGQVKRKVHEFQMLGGMRGGYNGGLLHAAAERHPVTPPGRGSSGTIRRRTR